MEKRNIEKLEKIGFKVILVGEQGVGKTSLILRYIKDVFSNDYQVTIGFEFFSKILKHRGKDITIQIWDTAGQQAFKSMIRAFYRNAACVFLTFSLQRPSSLEALNRWISEVHKESSQQIVIILVGTKSDLVTGHTEGLRRQAQEFKKFHHIDLYMEVSSKNATNTELLFTKALEIMYDKYQKNPEYKELVSPSTDSFLLPLEDPDQNDLTINKDTKKKKSCC